MSVLYSPSLGESDKEVTGFGFLLRTRPLVARKQHTPCISAFRSPRTRIPGYQPTLGPPHAATIGHCSVGSAVKGNETCFLGRTRHPIPGAYENLLSTKGPYCTIGNREVAPPPRNSNKTLSSNDVRGPGEYSTSGLPWTTTSLLVIRKDGPTDSSDHKLPSITPGTFMQDAG